MSRGAKVVVVRVEVLRVEEDLEVLEVDVNGFEDEMLEDEVVGFKVEVLEEVIGCVDVEVLCVDEVLDVDDVLVEVEELDDVLVEVVVGFKEVLVVLEVL